MLGVQTDASKLLEQIAGIIRRDNPEQEPRPGKPRQVFAGSAVNQVRRVIQDKLQYFARP